jgi:predicted transcriptional regulator
LFPWKKLIVGFSLAQYAFEGFLSLRQYQVLKQTKPPKVLKNEVSQEVFDKSQVWKPNNSILKLKADVFSRHMEGQKQSMVSLAVSTVKSKTRHSSTSTFFLNSGL